MSVVLDFTIRTDMVDDDLVLHGDFRMISGVDYGNELGVSGDAV